MNVTGNDVCIYSENHCLFGFNWYVLRRPFPRISTIFPCFRRSLLIFQYLWERYERNNIRFAFSPEPARLTEKCTWYHMRVWLFCQNIIRCILVRINIQLKLSKVEQSHVGIAAKKLLFCFLDFYGNLVADTNFSQAAQYWGSSTWARRIYSY
jgi:hypothetical protein